MRRNVVPVKKFQILFTTIRHLTSWAEGLARYEIRWEDSNAVVMVSPFDHHIQSNVLYSIIVHRRHYTGLRGVSGSIATNWCQRSNERNLTGFRIKNSIHQVKLFLILCNDKWD
jgi:hypothetical protein